MQPSEVPHTWSSRFVFILAAVGAAVGLGNIWKFPYTAGISGGGAFVLIYIVAIVAVAVPIVMAELLIGRRGRRSPVTSIRKLAERARANPAWRFVGWLNITAVFLILTFYSVIAGWALAYAPKVVSGLFVGASADRVDAEFQALLASPAEMVVWHGVFLAMTVAIVSLGLESGIERAVKILMPALFAMLLVLMGYAGVAGDLAEASRFLFAVDFSKIDSNVVLMAIGQAFFSVSVAMGLMITYGAYMRPAQSIPVAAVVIAAADTLVALMAGLAIFPLVFANGLDPAEGPGLIFVTLPIAFGNMPAGTVFGTIFFVLLIFAALTSSIAILEAVISPAVERAGSKRWLLALEAGVAAWVVGLATVFSFNLWDEVRPLGAWQRFANSTIFDVIDYLASNIMLPLGGVLIAIFAGWTMSRSDTRDELGLEDNRVYRSWRFLIRYVAPVGVGAVLVANLI